MSSWENQQPSSRRSIENRVLLVDEAAEGEPQHVPHGPIAQSLPVRLLHVADRQDKKDKGLDPKEIWRGELDEKILKYWNVSDKTYYLA